MYINCVITTIRFAFFVEHNHLNENLKISTYSNDIIISAAGPLTQWELIFYGTETPPQEYDASPETNSLNGGGSGVVLTHPEKPSGGGTSWSGASEPAESAEEVRQNALDDDLTHLWHTHSVSLNSLFVVYSVQTNP